MFANIFVFCIAVCAVTSSPTTFNVEDKFSWSENSIRASTEPEEEGYNLYRHLMETARDIKEMEEGEPEGIRVIKRAFHILMETFMDSIFNGLFPAIERRRRREAEGSERRF